MRESLGIKVNSTRWQLLRLKAAAKKPKGKLLQRALSEAITLARKGKNNETSTSQVKNKKV